MVAENTILKKADKILAGARRKSYGVPLDACSDIATMWNVQLRDKLSEPLTAEDIPCMMIALKLCREANAHQEDNLIDIAGYAGVFGMVVEEQDRRKAKGKRKQKPRKVKLKVAAKPAKPDPLPNLNLGGEQ